MVQFVKVAVCPLKKMRTLGQKWMVARVKNIVITVTKAADF